MPARVGPSDAVTLVVQTYQLYMLMVGVATEETNVLVLTERLPPTTGVPEKFDTYVAVMAAGIVKVELAALNEDTWNESF